MLHRAGEVEQSEVCQNVMKDVMKKVVVVVLTRIVLPPGKNYR